MSKGKGKPKATLPLEFASTLKVYEVVDAALCFLLKSRMAPTLSSVAGFFERMSRDSGRDVGLFHPSVLSVAVPLTPTEVVSSFCSGDAGGVLELQWVPDTKHDVYGEAGHLGDRGHRLEVVFSKDGGLGARNAKKRLAAVEKALAAKAAESPGGGDAGLAFGPTFMFPSAAAPPEPVIDGGSTSAAPSRVPPPSSPLGASRLVSPSSSSSSSSSSQASLSSVMPLPRADPSSTGIHGDLEPRDILETLKQLPSYNGQVAHVQEVRQQRHTSPCVLCMFRSSPQPLQVPAREGCFVEMDSLVFGTGQPVLSAAVRLALSRRGIERLFEHQARAITAALSGSHVALSTGTSSGKSACFNVPVLETILDASAAGGADAVALYIFPTKALAQDQLGALQAMIDTDDSGASDSGASSCLRDLVRPAVVDGDTSHANRGLAKQAANVILTNPDMLHIAILPNWRLWRRVLAGLRFIVLDEAHSYRGIFGAHVAMVLRRLVRLCRVCGNASGPQFIYCSATIANPSEHFSQLVPLHVLGGLKRLEVICDDGAPRGEKLVIIWNPPRIGPFVVTSPTSPGHCASKCDDADECSLSHDADECILAPAAKRMRGSECDSAQTTADASAVEGPPVVDGSDSPPPAPRSSSSSSVPDAVRSLERSSTIVETARLFVELVKRGTRTLCFAKTRKLTELVLRNSLLDLRSSAPELAGLVQSYRGGYTREDRRRIERDLFSSQLLGVTATCALELGIDVGALDATLHVGFPGSVNSLWQQAGRAGRGGRRSVAVLVCFDSPLDQLFARCPRELFDRPPETAIIPVANVHVLKAHLLCAAKESPLRFAHTSRQPLGQPPSAPRGVHVSHSLADHERSLAACLAAEGSHGESHEPYDRHDDGALFGYAACLEAAVPLMHEGSLVAVTTSTVLASSAAAAGAAAAGQCEPCVETVTACESHLSVEAPATDNAANIRMIDPVTIQVVDTTLDEATGGRIIDSIGYSRAFYELFEGAVYLHQAKQYLVQKLDLCQSRALVKPVKTFAVHPNSQNDAAPLTPVNARFHRCE